jgi:AsmA protein
MSRFFRILGWVVGITAALLAAAVVFVLLTFDPNKYKADIAAAVHNATGRQLTIKGDLKLSFFPWLGVETGAMSLSNPPEFGPEPFARIKDAAIKVKLLPLLKKEVEVDTVTLNGLYLNLIRTTAGHGDWEQLAAKSSGKTQAATPAGQHAAPPLLAAFAIGGVRIQNATVIWDDRRSKTRYELNNFALHTGPVSLNAPVTLSLATDIKSSAPAIALHLDLATRAHYDLTTRQLRLTNLKLDSEARGPALPADTAKLDLNTDAVLELAENQYRLNNLKLLVGLRGDALPEKHVAAALTGGVKVDLDKGTVDADPLNLKAWNVHAKGVLHGRELLTSPHFSGSLHIPAFDARELLGHLSGTPLNTADGQALRAVSADMEFNASTTAAELSKLQAKLDRTRITGTASLADFSHPAYRFRFAVDDIDADRYLPPATAAGAKPATPATAAGAGAAELPLPMLRSLNIDGHLTVGKLKIARLTLSDIKLGLKAAAGTIRLYPLAAQLYGGTYRGDLQLDARGKAARLGMNESLHAVQIGPLSRDLLQKDLVAGNGNVRLQLTGTGLSPDELKRTVTGHIGFSLHHGRVNGVNLLDMIQKDYVKYVQALAMDTGKLNQTVFSKFAATAKVDKGVITTNDLVLNSAQLDVKGHGKVNLVNEGLAMRLDATPRGQFAKQLGQFKDTVIPIRVEGSFSNPKFTADLDQVLKQQAKARLEKEKQKARAELQRKADEEKAKLQQKLKQQQEQAGKKLKEQLQNKLNDLFK